MTLTTLITVNAVLAAIVVYGIVWLLAHSVSRDRRHAESHLWSRKAAEHVRERNQIAA
jgi:hypothetical protein